MVCGTLLARVSLTLLVASGCAVALAAEDARQLSASGSSIPPALRACIEYREAIRKADVRWSGSSSASQRAPGVEFGRRTLLAGDDLAEFDFGNELGVTGFDGDTGAPIHHPTKQLFNREMRVRHDVGMPYANVEREYDYNPDFPDVRTFGLLPTKPPVGQSPGELLRTYPPKDETKRTYSQEPDGDLIEVTLHLSSGNEVHWWIDPQRGHNVVRSELFQDGKITNYAICEIRPFGQSWFPAIVNYYRSDRDVPLTTHVIASARFNEADMPDELGIRDLGLEPGTALQFAPSKGELRGELFAWTGEEIMPGQKWIELRDAGLVEPGPGIRAWELWSKAERTGEPITEQVDLPEDMRRIAPYFAHLAAATQPSSAPAEHPWEAYTREFIRIAEFDDPQQQKAWQIYHACRQQGDAYVASRRPQIEKLNQQAEEIRTSGDAEFAEQLAALDDDRRRLFGPLDRMFERVLKRDLMKLLTRAQREKHFERLDALLPGGLAP